MQVQMYVQYHQTIHHTQKKMSETNEVSATPITSSTSQTTPPAPAPAPVCCPPTTLYDSPSMCKSSPLLNMEPVEILIEKGYVPTTPKSSPTDPRHITPSEIPERNLQNKWLLLFTESGMCNKYYSAFHALFSGIGVQALLIPAAFLYLGWTWGIISLTVVFLWQLYTLWILIQLHESGENGMRYNSYLDLIRSALGEKKANVLAKFPILYLSGTSCTVLIMIGGSALRTFFDITCGSSCSEQLKTKEWYLVFTSIAVLISLLPNLNSIATVILTGAITVIGYCSSIWILSVGKGSLPEVSYDPIIKKDNTFHQAVGVLVALGIIGFAFRGHNLVLEIQSTIPSNEMPKSHVPMWKGVKVAYTLIGFSLFPLAIGGYWAYGQEVTLKEDILATLYKFHFHDVSHFVLGLICIFVIINSIISFQIYGMPTYDELESIYTNKKNKPCPWWLRALIRSLFGYSNMISILTSPILGSIAALAGGITMPMILICPCFMWLKITKPKKFSTMWWLNWGLGVLGSCLSVLVVAASFCALFKIVKL